MYDSWRRERTRTFMLAFHDASCSCTRPHSKIEVFRVGLQDFQDALSYLRRGFAPFLPSHQGEQVYESERISRSERKRSGSRRRQANRSMLGRNHPVTVIGVLPLARPTILPSVVVMKCVLMKSLFLFDLMPFNNAIASAVA